MARIKKYTWEEVQSLLDKLNEEIDQLWIGEFKKHLPDLVVDDSMTVEEVIDTFVEGLKRKFNQKQPTIGQFRI